MKKIVVLASLLVSLSFGLTQYSHFYSIMILEWAKAGKLPIGKPCEKVQDKVDGCHIMTERKDGGLDQIVVYKDKKIYAFYRVFNSLYPPVETELIVCGRENSNVEDIKMGCARRTGETIAGGGEVEQFKGDAKELIKKYVKQ